MTTPSPTIDPNADRDWYFTFGFDHHHPRTGQRLNNSYIKLHGTCDGTRDQMRAAFGDRWAMQYDSAERAGVERYRLTEVQLPGAVDEPGDADYPTVAGDVAAVRGMLAQLRVLEREHGRQPSAELWDGAEALTGDITDRLARIERLAAAR